MAHNVKDSRNHLIARNAECELRIQNCELRHHFFAKHFSDFKSLSVICNNRSAIHFGTCAHHCQHRTNGNELLPGQRIVLFQIKPVPGIAVIVCGCADSLGVVNGRASAHGKNEINIILAHKFHTLIEFFHRRIGHNTAVFDNFLSLLLQDFHNLIVNAIAFDAASAITEHYGGTLVFQLIGKEFQRIIAKIKFCWI